MGTLEQNRGAAARYRARNPEKHREAVRRSREKNGPYEDRRTPEAKAAANRRYYEAARAKDPGYPMRHYSKKRQVLHDLKSNPCVDCGQRYLPDVMDFDHVRGDKKYTISAHKVSRKDFAEELAKCELRCANCHRTRHALERMEHGLD